MSIIGGKLKLKGTH